VSKNNKNRVLFLSISISYYKNPKYYVVNHILGQVTKEIEKHR
jgi:hypothetical protein